MAGWSETIQSIKNCVMQNVLIPQNNKTQSPDQNLYSLFSYTDILSWKVFFWYGRKVGTITRQLHPLIDCPLNVVCCLPFITLIQALISVLYNQARRNFLGLRGLVGISLSGMKSKRKHQKEASICSQFTATADWEGRCYQLQGLSYAFTCTSCFLPAGIKIRSSQRCKQRCQQLIAMHKLTHWILPQLKVELDIVLYL